MATNTTLCDYALYDMNNHQGKVPWLDDATLRATAVTRILGILSVPP